MTDSQLMTDYRQGNEHALNALFERHNARLLAWLERRTADAHDVAQETWLYVVNYHRQFDAMKGSFANWLYMIAGQRATKSQSTSRRTIVCTLQPLARRSRDEAVCRELARLVGQLPSEQRETLQARYYRGQQQIDIARTDGVTAATVYRRERRALSELATKLGKWQPA